jgi:quercetin dioxygenase-like cupin family protein
MTADREVLVESKDSTIVAPEVHQVVFENEHVRVIDARAANGAKVAMHSHPPMLFIGVGSGRQKVTLSDGETQVLDLNPGMVAWRDDPLEHAWELLAGEVHVILVEVKSANARTPIDTLMKDENAT